MVVENSMRMIFTFTLGTIVVSAFMAPLAQSIWGIYIPGYKTVTHTICSILMLSYSKGNLNSILYLSNYWALFFISSYYLIFVFLCRSAFCQLQKISVQQVCLQTGFQEGIIEVLMDARGRDEEKVQKKEMTDK